ncbi:hypothetical protein D3C72_958110 [compost metagenome]
MMSLPSESFTSDKVPNTGSSEAVWVPPVVSVPPVPPVPPVVSVPPLPGTVASGFLMRLAKPERRSSALVFRSFVMAS